MAAKRSKKAKSPAELIISKTRTKGAAKKCNVSSDFYGALDKKVRVIIASGPQDARLIREGKITILEGSVGDKISFIPITDHVVIAETEGLAYPMANQTVQSGSTLTLSNSFTAQKAIIKVKLGRMLCFQMHQGFEE